MRQVDIVKLFTVGDHGRVPQLWVLHLAYDGGAYTREDLEAIRDAIDEVLKEESK